MNDQKYNIKNLQDTTRQIIHKMAQLHKSILKIKEKVEPVIKQYQQNISSAVKSLEVNSQAKQTKLLAYSKAFG